MFKGHGEKAEKDAAKDTEPTPVSSAPPQLGPVASTEPEGVTPAPETEPAKDATETKDAEEAKDASQEPAASPSSSKGLFGLFKKEPKHEACDFSPIFYHQC